MPSHLATVFSHRKSSAFPYSAQTEYETMTTKLCSIQSQSSLQKHTAMPGIDPSVQVRMRKELVCISAGGISILQASHLLLPRGVRFAQLSMHHAVHLVWFHAMPRFQPQRATLLEMCVRHPKRIDGNRIPSMPVLVAHSRRRSWCVNFFWEPCALLRTLLRASDSGPP